VGKDVRVYERKLLAIGSAVGVHKLKAEVIEKNIAHVQTMLIGDGVSGFSIKANAVNVSAVNLIHWYHVLSFDVLIIAQLEPFVKHFF
jgi:hypothetical protein